MRVVYLNSSGQLGGVENVLLDLLASLRETERSWELHLVVPADGPLVERARALGVEVELIPFPRSLARLGDAGAGGPAGRRVSRTKLLLRALRAAPETFLYARRLRRALHALAPTLVHANGFKMHALAALTAPARVPLVWHLHDYVGCRPVAARLLRRLARRASLVVANSESVARDARALFGEKTEVRTVYNAVDLRRFARVGPSADLDALAGLPAAEQGTVRVGLISTLARWKGHETFLRALALLPPHLRVRGYVVGGALYETDGSQHRPETLRRMAGELGLGERVGFTGFVADTPAAMRALDVVVHASTEAEPFGLVIAEAFACGRAVVAASAGGAAELFTDGQDALAHAPGDAASLAAALVRLVSDAQLRQTLGTRARKTAEQRFNRTRLAVEWAAIYNEVSRREEMETWMDRMDRIKRKDECGVVNAE